MDNQNPLLNVPPPCATEDRGAASNAGGPGDHHRHLILKGEVLSNLVGLLDRYADHLNPTNVIDDFLGHGMLMANWRIWRVQCLELVCLDSQMAEVPAVVAASVSAAVLACRTMAIASGMMNLLRRFEAAVRRTWHLSFRGFLEYRGLCETKRTQPDPPAATTAPPPTANRPKTQNEPRTETTRQTKETPCDPQPAT